MFATFVYSRVLAGFFDFNVAALEKVIKNPTLNDLTFEQMLWMAHFPKAQQQEQQPLLVSSAEPVEQKLNGPND